MTKKQAKEAAIAAGRAHLKSWLKQAAAHGTIWYSVVHVSRSGTRHQIKLYRVTTAGKPTIVQLWPSACSLHYEAETVLGGYGAAVDVVAKDWGLSFKDAAFIINGCGMNMALELLDKLGRMVGLELVGKIRLEML